MTDVMRESADWIDLIERLPATMPAKEDRPSIEHCVDLLRWTQQQRPRVTDNTFWERVKDEPDFALWFGGLRQARYELRGWIPLLGSMIEEHIGPEGAQAVNRTLHGFGRLSPGVINQMVADGQANALYDGQYRGIVVRDSGEFFGHYLNLTGIGPAAAAGVLCVGAFQTEILGY